MSAWRGGTVNGRARTNCRWSTPPPCGFLGNFFSQNSKRLPVVVALNSLSSASRCSLSLSFTRSVSSLRSRSNSNSEARLGRSAAGFSRMLVRLPPCSIFILRRFSSNFLRPSSLSLALSSCFLFSSSITSVSCCGRASTGIDVADATIVVADALIH